MKEAGVSSFVACENSISMICNNRKLIKKMHPSGFSLALFGAFASLLILPGHANAQQAEYQTLFSFDYDPAGGFPAAGVVQDNAGNLYGTTSGGGGGSEDGVVFKLAPGANNTWAETILYTFSSGADGSTPDAGLTLDRSSGKLYGTAEYTFGHSTGVVFELAPPTAQGGSWTYRVIYTFSGGSDGGVPEGELLLASNGSLYGTTASGGSYGAGVVFGLEPPSSAGGDWTYISIHSFYPATDGQNPFGPVAADERGNIFGATEGGGNPGTVFEVSPHSGGAWSFQVIHRFSGADGSQSYTGVVRRPSDGVLFGGTDFGGASNLGVVFQLTPPSSGGGVWAEQTIYTFTGGADGCNPSAVAVGTKGEIYGSTSSFECANGSLFRLGPPTAQHSNWTFTTLVQDDNDLIGPLLLNRTGLYGTEYFGGSTGQGAVFRLD